jgi:CRISPR/Cas system-associated exonuclease Cas4 (RecB family)
MQHAELSASSSEIWTNCAGAPALWKNAPPEKESIYAMEGTEAHELLEIWARHVRDKTGAFTFPPKFSKNPAMIAAVRVAIDDIKKSWNPGCGKELVIEEKVYLKSVDPTGGMYGYMDLAIVEHFGTLEASDYKHGQGVRVDVYKETASGIKMLNPQLVYYVLALAEKYDFNFKDVILKIIQPRFSQSHAPIRAVRVTIKELMGYIELFKRAVDRTKQKNAKRSAGPWCRFCKAKSICTEGNNGYRTDSRSDF